MVNCEEGGTKDGAMDGPVWGTNCGKGGPTMAPWMVRLDQLKHYKWSGGGGLPAAAVTGPGGPIMRGPVVA